jgi:hypothetical protein
LSEISVFLIWTAVIVLTAAMMWGFSTGLRDELTIRTVNKFLDSIGESNRIEQVISPWYIPGSVTQLGTWYTMTSKENAVISPLIMNGIFSPCLAIIDGEGRLSTLVPLTVNGDRGLARINPGYLRIWMDRIEKNAVILKRIQGKRN